MSFTKAKGKLLDTFEADNLDDSLDGIVDFLENNEVPDNAGGPETVIILSNSAINGNDRTWKGVTLVGHSKEEILKIVNEKF